MTNDRYRHRHLPAGTLLCQEGDFGETMYLVLSGNLQISKRVTQGADRVLATLGRGQYVGELSLLTGAQRSATIRALEATEVIEIDQHGFLQLLQDQPHLCMDLLQQLAHRLRDTTEELMLTALEAALAQREPQRAPVPSQRMRLIATGSCTPENLAAVLHLAAAQVTGTTPPALVSSMFRPGRTEGVLVYLLDTASPGELLEVLAPFTGLVQWDISPALDLDTALVATAPPTDGARAPDTRPGLV